ncbi:GntR family transcriptional regulator [Chryseobacterium sp. 1B4]
MQIADVVCEKILLKQWLPEVRIPSVRDFANQVIVNPNTIMRTYEFLEQKGIITNQRGIGFSISKDGYEKVLAYKKKILQSLNFLIFSNSYTFLILI